MRFRGPQALKDKHGSSLLRYLLVEGRAGGHALQPALAASVPAPGDAAAQERELLTSDITSGALPPVEIDFMPEDSWTF
jgi:hypothetical protein